MPGSGDYFNTFLVNDFNNLDKEMGGSQWFQKEQERDSQKELAEQNELAKGQMGEEKESPPSTTSDPFRPTYDRKKSTENKKDRLERIKKEYEHKPFISVGAFHFWDDLRKRRDKRKQVQEQITDQSLKEGLSANSPNMTQEVEQNESTIMPMPKFNSLKGFCKRAAWEDEGDPTEAADWWKPEEEREETIKEKLERKLKAIPPEGKVVEIPGTEELSRLSGKITPDNVKELFKQYLNKYFAKDIAAINRDMIARDEGDPITSIEQANDSEYGFSGSISIWNSFLDAHGNYDAEILAGHPDTTTDPRTLWGAWKEIIKEDPTLVDRIDTELKDTAEKIKKDYAHSAEDLDKWLQASGAKRFCKKATGWSDVAGRKQNWLIKSPSQKKQEYRRFHEVLRQKINWLEFKLNELDKEPSTNFTQILQEKYTSLLAKMNEAVERYINYEDWEKAKLASFDTNHPGRIDPELTGRGSAAREVSKLGPGEDILYASAGGFYKKAQIDPRLIQKPKPLPPLPEIWIPTPDLLNARKVWDKFLRRYWPKKKAENLSMADAWEQYTKIVQARLADLRQDMLTNIAWEEEKKIMQLQEELNNLYMAYTQKEEAAAKGFCKRAWEDEEDDPTRAGDWWKPEEEKDFQLPEEALDITFKTLRGQEMSVRDIYAIIERDREQLAKFVQMTPQERNALSKKLPYDFLKEIENIWVENLTISMQELARWIGPKAAMGHATQIDRDFTNREIAIVKGLYDLRRAASEALTTIEQLQQMQHEAIPEPMPGEVPSSDELEKWLKSSDAKRFCKRAEKVKNKLASLEDIDAAREVLLSTIEKGFDDVRALGLETSLNPVADVFEKELAHPENTLGSIFSNEQYVDFIGVRLRSLLIELRRIVSQYEQNPEIAKNVKAIIKSLEEVRDRYGL